LKEGTNIITTNNTNSITVINNSKDININTSPKSNLPDRNPSGSRINKLPFPHLGETDNNSTPSLIRSEITINNFNELSPKVFKHILNEFK